jgi:thiazole tautomerase (transcriptional regulator TenI)
VSKLQLHVITDGKKTKEELVEILSGIHPYADFIHIREKHRSAKELFEMVEAFIANGVPPRKLFLNDRVDVAHVLNISGVQLAYHSLGVSEVRRCFPELRVGCSVHTYEEAVQAEKDGADFVLYGHIYPTASKSSLVPKGLAELKLMTRSLGIPVIAIGGITPEKLPELKACGVKGAAIMSGIMDARDYVEAAKEFIANTLVEEEENL